MLHKSRDFFCFTFGISMSTLLKTILELQVNKTLPQSKRGRPKKLSFDETFECLETMIRTGMQWRYVKSETVVYTTVYRRVKQWVESRCIEEAFKTLLKVYWRRRRPKFYCIDSSFVKNQFGVDCVGENPTDRGKLRNCQS